MNSIYYINDLDTLINKVELQTNENKRIPLVLMGSNKWVLHDKTNRFEKYFFIINDIFVVPSLNNKFEIVANKNTIFSLAETNHNQSEIVIEDLLISKQIVFDEESNDIKAKFQSSSFTSIDDEINIVCYLSNIKNDSVIHVEIFSSKKIIGIIPALIEKSKNGTTYFCSLKTSNFEGINDVITVRVKTDYDRYVSKTFKFTSYQSYSLNQIKKNIKPR